MAEVVVESLDWTVGSDKNEVTNGSVDGSPNNHSQGLRLALDADHRFARTCRHVVARDWPTLIDGVAFGGDLQDLFDFCFILPRRKGSARALGVVHERSEIYKYTMYTVQVVSPQPGFSKSH